MTYQVLLHRKALKALESLDQKIRKSVQDTLRDLTDYPEALKRHDTAKVKGVEETFRIRIGSLRVIFHVDRKNRLIMVTSIEQRAKAYNHL